MAYTVEQEPENWVHGTLYPIVYTVHDDTNSGADKFEYICDVYVGGVKVARLEVLPNDSDYGVFRVDRILDDFVAPTRQDQNGTKGITFTGVSTATPYSKCLNTMRRVEFKFGVKYAASATAAPTIYADQITGNFLNVIKAHSNTLLSPIEADEYDNSNIDSLEQNGASDPFISVVPRVSGSATIYSTAVRFDQDIMSGQAHCLSFMNDITSSSATGAVSYLHVAGFTAAGGTVFNETIQNTSVNGGEPPSSSNSDDERLLYFGSGFVNLQGQTLNSTISTGMGISSLAYYEIVGASSATLNSSTARTAVYRFNIKHECKYPTKRLMFLNPFGGWDFYNFELASETSVAMERKTFYQSKGNYSDATDNWGYSTWDGGQRVMNTSAQKKLKLNTDWVGESFNHFFEALFSSREVYLLENKGAVNFYMTPVVITSSSVVHKTSAVEGLAAYELELEYSNKSQIG